VLIPPPLRRWAGLESQVVVAGVGEAIEIWSAAAFEAALEAEDSEFRETLGVAPGAAGPE
jgi:MraZ protein